MYYLGNDVVDSIDLKCFVVSRGAKVDKQVYQKYGKNTRLNPCLLYTSDAADD